MPRRRLSFQSQLESADCGATCLAIVLDYFGKFAPTSEIQDLTDTGRDGVSVLGLVRAAEHFKLSARAVKADADVLRRLPIGTILFWDHSHFVVFEKSSRSFLTVVDPARGRLRVRWEDASSSYSGVAILVEPSETFQKGRRQRHRGVVRHLRPLLTQRSTLRRTLITSLMIRVFALSLPLLTAVVVDRVVPASDRPLLTIVAGSLGFALLFHFLSSWLRARMLLELRTRVDLHTTMGFVEHLLALPYSFHLRRSTGDLVTRLRSNSVVREVLTTGTLATAFDSVFASLYLVLLWRVSGSLAALALLLAALQVLVIVAARRSIQTLTSQALQAEAQAQGYAVQMLEGIETLKATGTEGTAVDEFGGLFREELKATVSQGRLKALVDSLTTTVALGSPLVVLTYTTVQVLDGSMSLGIALASNALAQGLFAPIASIVATGLTLLGLRSYLDRLNDVFDARIEQSGRSVCAAPTFAGRVEADDVTFAYSKSAPPVVRGASLLVQPGQSLALVGRSGSGKTTLASLLVGLYEPDAGAVRHDGHELSDLDLRTVRRQVAIVTQDPYLFGISIRDNISFGEPDMPLDAIREAARLACIEEDIQSFPMGYATVLSEGGSSLSGGQRQRLALARALARRPAVLVLDEATSQLDAVTEAEVHANLRTLSCTTIVVAHRLSTVVSADKILMMEAGTIVEEGTHVELLRRGGSYAALVASQLGPPVEAARLAMEVAGRAPDA